jgi:hypothetical protein
MSFAQHSFELDVTRQPSLQSIRMHSPLDPKEFMGAVNQSGKLKIHALVDTFTEKTKHDFLVVGTGRSIDDEFINRLVRLETLIFNDGQHGYTIYYIRPESDELDEEPNFDELSDCITTSDGENINDSIETVDSEDVLVDSTLNGNGLITIELVENRSQALDEVVDILIFNMKSRQGVSEVKRIDSENVIQISVVSSLWTYDSIRENMIINLSSYGCVKKISY